MILHSASKCFLDDFLTPLCSIHLALIVLKVLDPGRNPEGTLAVSLNKVFSVQPNALTLWILVGSLLGKYQGPSALG